MQVAGFATVLILGSFMVLAFRRDFREGGKTEPQGLSASGADREEGKK